MDPVQESVVVNIKDEVKAPAEAKQLEFAAFAPHMTFTYLRLVIGMFGSTTHGYCTTK